MDIMKTAFVLVCCISVAWGCAPNDEDAECPVRLRLTDDQIRQIDANRARITELETNPEALYRAQRNYETIVDLTPQQEQDAIDINPGFFMTRDKLPNLDMPLVDNVPHEYDEENKGYPIDGQSDRQKRVAGPQRCLPDSNWMAQTLALNYNDDLVQIMQTSSDSKQWVIDEECLYTNDPGNSNPCRRTSKPVPVYVIDFSDFSFTVVDIQIFCCVTFNN